MRLSQFTGRVRQHLARMVVVVPRVKKVYMVPASWTAPTLRRRCSTQTSRTQSHDDAISIILRASIIRSLEWQIPTGLLISLVPVAYHPFFKCIVGTDEMMNYARWQHGFRVLRATVAQRSTYWFQLCYWYILPLMELLFLLHWLVS